LNNPGDIFMKLVFKFGLYYCPPVFYNEHTMNIQLGVGI
jgi:hypothetical protein